MINQKIKRVIINFLKKYIGGFFVLLLSLTYRYKTVGNNYKSKKCIYTFWHRNLFPLVWAHSRAKIGILVSKSKDGDSIAKPLEFLGYSPVRGSSDRGSTVAVKKMYKHSKKYSLGITPDGPKGPRFKIKDGVLFICYITKLPILIIDVKVKSAWIFNSWDKFVLPKPFSQITLSYQEPIFIRNKSEIESYKHKLEKRMKKSVSICDI